MSAVKPIGGLSLAPAVCNFYQSAEDGLEAQIEAERQRMCDAPIRENKLVHWREMCRLIDQRTPHRVRFMERMRGLA